MFMSLTENIYKALNSTVGKVINGITVTGFIPDTHRPKLVGHKDNTTVFIDCVFRNEKLVIA